MWTITWNPRFLTLLPHSGPQPRPSTAIDVWSVGCICAQFLKYCKDMLKDSLERLRQAYDQVRNMQRIKKIPKDEADEMVKN